MITQFEELNINQYIKIFEILRENISEVDQNIKILAVILDKTSDEILEMPITEVSVYMKQLSLIKNKPEPYKLKKEYVLNGTTYTVFKDYKNLLTAQYLDFQNFGGDLEKNIKEILSIMLIPKGCKYGEGYDIDELREIIGKELKVGEGLALISFFGIQLRKSIRDSLQSSKKLLKKTLKMMKEKDPEAYEKMKASLDGCSL